MYISDSANGRGQKCANALETKNIDFPLGKCTLLETEEGLDVAWERKILVFLQEKKYICIYIYIYISDNASGRGQKCANALVTKNIDFSAGK